MTSFSVPVEGGALVGARAGAGPPALLLHGGPGITDYLGPLAAELGDVLHTIRYQQRGLAPSVETGAKSVDGHVVDAVAVLDGLGIARAWIVGHSWGGYLAMHVAADQPGRVLGVVVIDSVGASGDGGVAAFEAAFAERMPADHFDRAEKLEPRVRQGDQQAAQEQSDLYWPYYFAHPESAPPPMEERLDAAGNAEAHESMREHLKAGTLARALPRLRVPFVVVHGRKSPMPVTAAAETAALVRGAQLVIVEDCGHFPWLERPGAVAAAVAQVLGR